jgi:hypothetical protein
MDKTIVNALDVCKKELAGKWTSIW